MAVPHVVIFPFMAQGHILPLLDLSKALSLRQIKVTIITTPSNAKSISNYVADNHDHCHLPHIIQIPFPSPPPSTTDPHGLGLRLPHGCENTSQLPSMQFFLPFLHATRQLQQPFHQVLQTLVHSDAPPVCVISDFFLGWTLYSCQKLGVPRLVFHGMSVLSMAISKCVWVHAPHLKVSSVSEPLDLPGLNLPFTLTTADLPLETINAPNLEDPLTQFISEVGEADANSWGIIVNSFDELERNHIPAFESFYKKGAKAWCLGPLFLYSNLETPTKSPDQRDPLIHWLNEQAPNSVIYVSFGSQADVSDPQLDEIAFGLEASECPFIWVVRSKTWALPAEINERRMKTKGTHKGMVIREWVEQRVILSHRATGGFLSHCGWNSVVESMAVGVPILGWPMIAEQGLNAKHVVEGLGAGIMLKKRGWRTLCTEGGVVVSREAVGEGVRELMTGEMGRVARERAQSLGSVARRSVQPSGSSQLNLTNLITQLCHP